MAQAPDGSDGTIRKKDEIIYVNLN